MPLLDITVSKKVSVTLSLEESTAKNVDRYAHFCKVPADDVVNKALEYVFSKDKDFQQHLRDLSQNQPLRASPRSPVVLPSDTGEVRSPSKSRPRRELYETAAAHQEREHKGKRGAVCCPWRLAPERGSWTLSEWVPGGASGAEDGGDGGGAPDGALLREVRAMRTILLNAVTNP